MSDMNIRSVGVIGAGTMGSGIAQAVAGAGMDVVLVDVSQQAVDKGIEHIDSSLERLIRKDKLSAQDKKAILGRIKGTTGYDALKPAGLIIEAATESYDLKVKIFREIESAVSAQTLLASNTSSISITRLAAQTDHPERFVGMHFFNPVPVMGLVEVIRGLQTSDATFEAVQALAQKLQKTPVAVKNAPGFVVNRILVPMINEAFFVLAEDVAQAEAIDEAMKLGANHPIGPLALADLIGLDVCLAIMEVLLQEFGDSKYRPAPLLRELVAAGRLGRKSGRGVFEY